MVIFELYTNSFKRPNQRSYDTVISNFLTSMFIKLQSTQNTRENNPCTKRLF